MGKVKYLLQKNSRNYRLGYKTKKYFFYTILLQQIVEDIFNLLKLNLCQMKLKIG